MTYAGILKHHPDVMIANNLKGDGLMINLDGNHKCGRAQFWPSNPSRHRVMFSLTKEYYLVIIKFP